MAVSSLLRGFQQINSFYVFPYCTSRRPCSTHEKSKSMLLRRLALWALAAAPASLTTCFVVPPSVRRPLGAVFEGGRLGYVRARTQRVATSAASGAVLVAAANQGIPSDDREDAQAATTRTGFVLAGGKVVVAASTAVTTAAAAAALVAVPPAFAAEREPEITSKCFIEVSQIGLFTYPVRAIMYLVRALPRRSSSSGAS